MSNKNIQPIIIIVFLLVVFIFSFFLYYIFKIDFLYVLSFIFLINLFIIWIINKLWDENKNLKRKIYEKDENILNLEDNIKRKFEKARDVHQRMLPKKLPDTGDIIFSAYYQPAEYIGGDYYNVLEIDHGSMSPFFDQYLVYYFDVSGHGIDSTLLSIFINDTIESFLKLRHNPGTMISPKELMDFIDEEYQNEGFPDDYLVCIFLGLLDLNKDKLNYCSVGFQYPIFKIKYKNGLEKIETGGLPISTALASIDKKLKEEVLSIEENSMILLSTDGLFEQEVDGETYYEKIDDILNDYGELPAPLLKDIIYADFYNFSSENKIKDDLTFLILNRLKDKTIKWDLGKSDLADKVILEEVIDFIEKSCDNQNINILNKFKKIIEKILLKEDKFINLKTLSIKAINNPEYLIFSFEDKKYNLNWKKLINNKFYDFIEIKNQFDRDEFEYNNNQIYISYNNFYNKIYLFLPK